MLSGTFSCATFSNFHEARVSYRIKRLTKIQGDNNDVWITDRLVTFWRKATSAAVVEPLGRKAYWSANVRVGGGLISLEAVNILEAI